MSLSIALPTSAGALIALIVILVLHGDLVTRPMVDRITAMYEKRVAEKDEQARMWREAHDTVKKANDALIIQLYQSLEIGRTTNSVLNALPSPSPGGHDDPHAVV